MAEIQNVLLQWMAMPAGLTIPMVSLQTKSRTVRIVRTHPNASKRMHVFLKHITRISISYTSFALKWNFYFQFSNQFYSACQIYGVWNPHCGCMCVTKNAVCVKVRLSFPADCQYIYNQLSFNSLSRIHHFCFQMFFGSEYLCKLSHLTQFESHAFQRYFQEDNKNNTVPHWPFESKKWSNSDAYLVKLIGL